MVTISKRKRNVIKPAPVERGFICSSVANLGDLALNTEQCKVREVAIVPAVNYEPVMA